MEQAINNERVCMKFVTKPNNEAKTTIQSRLLSWTPTKHRILYQASLCSCCRWLGLWAFQAYSGKPYIRRL